MNSTEYSKLSLVMRQWLKGLAESEGLGSRYWDCLEALHYFSMLHGDEVRKDGVTPGFAHQINMLAFARNLHTMLMVPKAVYVSILGHDGIEDYPLKRSQIESMFNYYAGYLNALDKNCEGTPKSKEVYFADLSECPVTSVVKAIDRIHNFSTMHGVFSATKIEKYVKEGREYFLPMLKRARRNFPQQSPVYELLKSVLVLQLSAMEHYLPILKQLPQVDAHAS